MDDPWDWTIDQVVEAVCYHTSPLLGQCLILQSTLTESPILIVSHLTDDVNIADITVSDPPAFERSLRDLNVKGACSKDST